MPTEVSGMNTLMPDQHNGTGRWQDGFRVGWLDAVLTRYAIEVCGGVDGIALTHLDRVPVGAKIATGYRSKNGKELILRKKKMLSDLREQEALTRLVQNASIEYRDLPKDRAALVTMIERELRVAVTITSRGPTWIDKRTNRSLALCA